MGKGVTEKVEIIHCSVLYLDASTEGEHAFNLSCLHR